MKTCRILVVDDKEENRYLLRVLLQSHKYTVDEAPHGAAALELARQQPPALVIADILMPVMDGFCLCREWKKDERLKVVPFLFYTATYTEEQDRKFALSLGAEQFVVKPAEPDVLMEVIQETLRKTGAPPDVPVQPAAEDAVYLRQYNETLIRKLESKMEQLEQANRRLEQDIAEQQREAEERDKLQTQLNQAQKMDSVGRLAGGVAHDFNNMLTAILGHVEMAMEHVVPEHPIVDDLQEIKKAVERSAELTRQLLAFARKQTIATKVLDLNATVDGMLKMLRRLIREGIELAWLPGKELWPVKMDPSQIDQILANLCVNARDAIGGVGRVTIETDNAIFDDAYCTTYPGVTPGEYVRLTVSDTGCGMDQETQSHIFEPFFTTKGVGQGAGLGLPTVYGIIKQNHGFINVYSEPCQGSTFKIYLPRYQGQAVPLPAAGPAAPLPRGRETILLVEDDVTILNITTKMLASLDYIVLPAATPGEAIRLAQARGEQIQLLITDVVMPEMNGRALAQKLLSFNPNLRRLFMSGYTADVIAHHGVLDDGVNFIQKPFSKQSLAAKIREVLDSGR